MLAVAAVASALVVQQARASKITGTLNQGGDITINSTSFASATAATAFASVNTSATSTGTYAVVPGLTGVTWTTPLSFLLGAQVVNNLWSFTVLGETYGFNLASITGYSVSGGDSFAQLTGFGTLTATGAINYDPTAGNFTLSMTDSSGGGGTTASFGFSASNTALPDGGLTVAMLGGVLVGLQILRRKVLC